MHGGDCRRSSQELLGLRELWLVLDDVGSEYAKTQAFANALVID